MSYTIKGAGISPASNFFNQNQSSEFIYSDEGINNDLINDENTIIFSKVSDVMGSEAYRNYVNSIVCGLDYVAAPWNENSTYEEVANLCYNNSTFQKLHEMELLEDRCLSMGLDPTGGGLNVTPGTRFLSSVNRPYFINGQPIPEAFEYDSQRTTVESYQQTGQYVPNQYQVQDFGRSRLTTLYNDYDFYTNVGQPVYHNFQTVQPNRQQLFTTAIIPSKLQPYVYVPDVYIEPPKDNSEEEIISYEKRKYAEENKQEIYNQIADMNYAIQQLYYQLQWVYDPTLKSNLEAQVNQLQERINEISSFSKTYNNPQEEYNEKILLDTNWRIEKYNKAVSEYEERQMNRIIINRNPELAKSLLSQKELEIQRQWAMNYGCFLSDANIPLYNSLVNKQNEINRYAENFERRRAVEDYRDAVINSLAIVAEYEEGADYEEAYQYYKELDPYGFNEILKRPEYETRYSKMQEELEREKPEDFPDYIPRFGKREKDLTDKERRLLRWGQRRAEIKYRDMYGSGITDNTANRVYVIDPRVSPITAAMLEASEEADKHPEKSRLKIFEEAVNVGLVKAEARKPIRGLDKMYDHRMFDETVHDFGIKTQIGNLSDLLANYETNESFKEAMNAGLINISVPEELGMSYNKDRIEFDNSIIEQFNRVKRPLPDDEDAYIKDPLYDTYHSTLTIEDITKEEYDKAIEANNNFIRWVSPELGGTYEIKQ